MDASLFSLEPIWMHEVWSYLETCQMPKTLNLVQKQKLTKKAEPFNLKKGKMYIMGQENKLCKCLITS
jgi:hypothetical protein